MRRLQITTEWMALIGSLLLILSLCFVRAEAQSHSEVGLHTGVVLATNRLAIKEFKTIVYPLPSGVGASGTVFIRWYNITGVAVGCNMGLAFTSQLAQPTDVGLVFTQVAFTPSATTTIAAYRFTPALGGTFSYARPNSAIAVDYTCNTYPASGQLDVEFVPDPVPSYVYKHITSNASTQIVGGELHNISIGTAGSADWIATIYDNAGNCSGTVAAIVSLKAQGYVLLDITGTTFATGGGAITFCVKTTGTTPGDITVSSR